MGTVGDPNRRRVVSQFYVGVKQVFAYPEVLHGSAGYHLVWHYGTPRELHGWMEKEEFESGYLPMGADGGNGTRVTPQMVVAMMGLAPPPMVEKVGRQTAMVQARLLTGFEITEVSACVDPANFDLDRGSDLAKDKIAAKVWHLLGFVLGWARNGLKGG